MPLARQLSVLSLYDLLTQLIPGATVALSAFIVFPVEETALASSSTTLAFAVLLGSFLSGHVVQWLRGKFGRQPDEFQQRMEAVRNGEERDAIHKRFLNQTNHYFAIDDGLDDADRLRLVLSYLETRPSVRALRFQSIYSFHRSLFVAALLGVGISVIALGLYACQAGLPVRGPLYIGFNGGAATLLAYASRERRDKFEGVFVGYAIREFYAEQIGEESGA